MAEAIQNRMGAVLMRWAMGSPAAAAVPEWSAALGSDAVEAELRLLAMSGQFLSVAMTAEPPGNLRTLPDIPPLALPTVPDALRPLLRRILGESRDTPGELLRFLADRGWTTHPDDWMPTADDEEAPDVYAPWRDWAAIVASAEASRNPAGDVLSSETWDDFWPSMRKAALGALRQRDAGAARGLMEAKFPTTGAAERLRLLGLLAIGLSEADAAFLRALAEEDRAPKVKALATLLLARLGHGAAASDGAAELAGFFESRSKGLLRRSKVIAPRPTKTAAQAARRQQLFAETAIAAFATALGLTQGDVVSMWSWGADVRADAGLVEMATRSAPDALIEALVEAIHRENPANAELPLLLSPRLTVAQRNAFARRVLGNGDSFVQALQITGGVARIDDAIATGAGTALLDSLGSEDRNPIQQANELRALGLIASRAGAAQAMERLARAGLLGADPRLDMLRLNAALEDRGVNP
jgi:hypothetical protein